MQADNVGSMLNLGESGAYVSGPVSVKLPFIYTGPWKVSIAMGIDGLVITIAYVHTYSQPCHIPWYARLSNQLPWEDRER